MNQVELEYIWRDYVCHILGADLAYDPKDMEQGEIAFRYRQAVKWGKANAPHMLKTGWTALKKTFESLPPSWALDHTEGND